MIAPPPSRNDRCPCGSGRRYKHCHGAAAPGLAEPRARARAALAAGDVTAAEAICRAALAEAPADAAVWILLGQAVRAGAPSEAAAAWRRALELEPRNVEAHFRLGNLLRELGDAPAAIAEFERGLDSAPGHAGLLNNLGLALDDLGDRDGAERCFGDVLSRDADQPEALGNLARARFEREAYADSAALYDRLFAIRSDLPAAVWVQRAIAQRRIGAIDAAEASFREATIRAPDDARILINLATLLTERGRYADAEPVLERALALAPRDLYARSTLAHARQRQCAWDGLEAMFAEIGRALEDEEPGASGAANPFAVLAMPLSPLAQLNAAKRWAARFAPAQPIAPPVVRATAGKPLRVGFVSSDLREHAVAYLIVELLERLDRDRIETYAYSLLPRDPSPFGSRIVRAFDHFVDVSAEPTAAIAKRIRDDGIAIVFDVNGYTTHERAGVFARRPAPIAINWLGYGGTLGADWIDYILTDRYITPQDQQPFFSERLLHLPNCLYPSDTRREVAAVAPSRGECGLPQEGFVFCCINNAYKILRPVFGVWMRLLAQVPGSVLWLHADIDEVAANLRREAAAHGIDPARLVFAPRLTLPRHFARLRHADLFVDTAPYNAATTANDALWMGVPLVTCPGATFISRIAGSQLHALGVPELATANAADYEALALRLARQPGELAALRARIAANRATHPLFDMSAYTRNFEESLLRVWGDHVAAVGAA